jgi:AraC-like DNA-binding protein
MLLLDSRTVPEQDRAGAVASRLAEASGASVALAPHERLHARMELWQLGRLGLFRNESSGLAMSRDERQARRDGGQVVALAVQERSSARHEQFGHRHDVPAGGLMLVDLSAPFAFSWSARGASRALQIPRDALELPADVVRAAAPRLGRSPLSDLVARHVVDLFRQAGRLADRPEAAAVGGASIDLVRALLSSAADGPAAHHDAVYETLATQVREVVRQNLRRPDLGPELIAAALNISVRHLYEVCSRAGISLEQLVITRRLDGAHQELAGPGSSHRTIGAIAHGWGFRDAAHFSRRFKAAYGITPRERRARAGSRRGPQGGEHVGGQGLRGVELDQVPGPGDEVQ